MPDTPSANPTETPLVTVLIPTRSRRNHLANALASVRRQTWTNLQIIICDNNSGDGTQALIAEIEDPRIVYRRSSADLTMLENWSRELGLIGGEYFVRLDDDNIFFPDFIECAVDKMQQNDVDAVGFACLNVFQNECRPFFDQTEQDYILTREELIHLEFNTQIDTNYILYRMSALKSAFPDMNIYETTLPDRYLDCQLAVMGYRFLFNTGVKGVTRFDFADRAEFDELNNHNCHFNYQFHRIWMIRKLLATYSDPEIHDFIHQYECSPGYFATIMKTGHVFMRPTLTRQEWRVFRRYLASIYRDYIRAHFRGVIIHKSAALNILFTTYKAFRLILKSLLPKGRRSSGIAAATGSTFERVALNLEQSGYDASSYKSMHGDFEQLRKDLRKVESFTPSTIRRYLSIALAKGV